MNGRHHRDLPEPDPGLDQFAHEVIGAAIEVHRVLGPGFLESVYEALKKTATVRARRWVVERTHGWMNRFRRILVRWEKREDTFFAMLHLVCGIIPWRGCDLLG